MPDAKRDNLSSISFFLPFLIYVYFMGMAVLACMSGHYAHAAPLTARRGHLIPTTGIIDGYETPWSAGS